MSTGLLMMWSEVKERINNVHGNMQVRWLDVIGLFFHFCLQQIFTRISEQREYSQTLLYRHPLNTNTPSFQTVFIVPGETPCNSLNSAHLIRTPINADHGHLLLAQSTDSHRKSTLLMWTLHYQLYVVINLSFLKVKNLSVDSMSMFWALLYTR